MKTIRLVIDLEYDDIWIHGGENEPESQEWFFNDVLSDDGNLILVSREIGDEVGIVRVVEPKADTTEQA